MSLLKTIKHQLDELGLRPNKILGQNFLVNQGIYRKILEASAIESDDLVVEIGPGLGTLTHHLARAGAKVIGVEKDRTLAEYLKKEFPINSRVEIVNQDILKFNPDSYRLEAGSYKLVGNVPYYLTGRLFKIVLEKWPMPERIVLMLQKEVAQRICAKPPDMSLLAVSVQYYSKPEIVARVSKGSFYPMPKVDSAIIRLTLHPNHSLSSIDHSRFFRVVKAGFAGKRKQLANNLASAFRIPKAEMEKTLLAAGIAPTRRAETLDIGEWRKISKMLTVQE